MVGIPSVCSSLVYPATLASLSVAISSKKTAVGFPCHFKMNLIPPKQSIHHYNWVKQSWVHQGCCRFFTVSLRVTAFIVTDVYLPRHDQHKVYFTNRDEPKGTNPTLSRFCRFDGDCAENNMENSVDKSKPWSRSIEDFHGGGTLPSNGSGISRSGRHSTLR